MDNLNDALSACRSTASPESVGKIVKLVYRMLYLGVLQKVRFDDAADVTQNIIVEVAENLHLFNGSSSREFFGWCYAISRAQIAQYYREREKRPENTHPDFEEFSRLLDKHSIEISLTEAENRDVKETNDELRKADPECYEIIFRRHVVDTDYKTLGADYGISADAARMSVERCIEKYLGGNYA